MITIVVLIASGGLVILLVCGRKAASRSTTSETIQGGQLLNNMLPIIFRLTLILAVDSPALDSDVVSNVTHVLRLSKVVDNMSVQQLVTHLTHVHINEDCLQIRRAC